MWNGKMSNNPILDGNNLNSFSDRMKVRSKHK